MEDDKKIAMLEAMLFATNEPLTIEDIKKTTKLKTEQIEAFLRTLKKRYEKPEHGIFLNETGGYNLSVKQEFSSIVANLAKADISKGLLRVLSIIACHEPVKQADIVRIIGNRTYEYTKTLQELGFVVAEKKGNTKVLKTTKQFEDYFATRKEEIKNLYKKMQEEKPKEEQKEDSNIEKKNS